MGSNIKKASITLHNRTPIFFGFDLNAAGDAFFEFGDVRDDADHPAGLMEFDEGIQGKIEGLAIESAKAFVDEDTVEITAATLGEDDIGETKSKGEGGKE